MFEETGNGGFRGCTGAECDATCRVVGIATIGQPEGALLDSGKRPGRLIFTHHGRAVLADPDGEQRKARAILGDCVRVADDGMRIEV